MWQTESSSKLVFCYCFIFKGAPFQMFSVGSLPDGFIIWCDTLQYDTLYVLHIYVKWKPISFGKLSVWWVSLLCKQHQSNQPSHNFTNDQGTSCVKTNSDTVWQCASFHLSSGLFYLIDLWRCICWILFFFCQSIWCVITQSSCYFFFRAG